MKKIIDYFFGFFQSITIIHPFFGKIIYQKGKKNKGYWESNMMFVDILNVFVSIETEHQQSPNENQVMFFKYLEVEYFNILHNGLENEILKHDYMHVYNQNPSITYKLSSINIPYINQLFKNFSDLNWEIGFDIFIDNKYKCYFLFSMNGHKNNGFTVDGY